MNRLQLTALIQLIFTTLEEVDNQQEERSKLTKEAKEFHDKHIKNLAKKDQPEDWGLTSKDQATLDKMEAKISQVSPQQIIGSMIEKGEGLINDPTLYESKNEVKSAYSPSELSEAINELEDKHEIVKLQYFTGVNEGEIVYCCGVKYLKAKKSS